MALLYVIYIYIMFCLDNHLLYGVLIVFKLVDIVFFRYTSDKSSSATGWTANCHGKILHVLSHINAVICNRCTKTCLHVYDRNTT